MSTALIIALIVGSMLVGIGIAYLFLGEGPGGGMFAVDMRPCGCLLFVILGIDAIVIVFAAYGGYLYFIRGGH